jgi:N-acyl-D-amino-acid deacylase
MHDTVIRGGTIVDGTGRPAFTGDVALDNGRITEVGGKAGPGRREIDADGLLVTPGWVDVHTHYDGQATWDPILAPSSWHGVTTVMFGNCGVGFAPVRKEHRRELIDLMEAIEDIPGVALEEGLRYDWESFPEFMDALERQPRAIDVAAQVPHHPLRVYVMGERAIRREKATAEDIAAMRRMTEDAMAAGAFGFTTSRTDSHKTLTGDFVPGRYSEVEELMGIGGCLAKFGYGAFGMNSDFNDEANELAWLTKLSKETGRPGWFLLTDRPRDPERWRRLIAGVHKGRAEGAHLAAQVAGRCVGIILGIDTSLNPFSIREGYEQYERLPINERLVRLRDPAVRAALLKAEIEPLAFKRLSQWDRMFVMGQELDYEPTHDQSIAAIAAKGNRSPEEVAYDYLTESAKNFLLFPTTNYNVGDYGPVREMLTDSGTILGLSDGGAHCGSIVDASVPSFMLTHWGRDRTRGPGLPIELLVRRQTSETADFFGFHDRGRLKAGLRADVNVIDHQGMRLHAPEIVHDLPAGGRRLIQRADGYVATLLAGTPIFENGAHTGALPGKLVRAGR